MATKYPAACYQSQRQCRTYTGFHGDSIQTSMNRASHNFIQQHMHEAAITTHQQQIHEAAIASHQ